jgi:hypothetical protein
MSLRSTRRGGIALSRVSGGHAKKPKHTSAVTPPITNGSIETVGLVTPNSSANKVRNKQEPFGALQGATEARLIIIGAQEPLALLELRRHPLAEAIKRIGAAG